MGQIPGQTQDMDLKRKYQQQTYFARNPGKRGHTLRDRNENALFKRVYDDLGLDFEIDTSKHLFIYTFSIDHFGHGTQELVIDPQTQSLAVKKKWIDPIIHNKGSETFYYSNIYEVLLWYHYYKHIHRHHMSHDSEGRECSIFNTSYFSRIPCTYRNLEPFKGLKLIKKILDTVIKTNNGLPGYFDKTKLNQLFLVK